ncbi:MAG: 50S ribosomal protein L3 N(5)-glutamine methyltransferase [Betaproteobacteria bacterium]|nr:50S ribosomal protein L3 N(5)-glutamine methyltransferase [Betaproteobacteria bacterium]
MRVRGPQTLRTVVAYGTRRFRAARLAYGHGMGSARDEAVYLALHALGLAPGAYDAARNARLSAGQIARVLDLYARRIRERKPAAFLTREAWLGEFRFYVDERVIVPRSHIAELLRGGLAPWVCEPGAIRSALDLCTGSGCLAVLIAAFFPHSRVDATDVSRNALAVARRNIDAYGLGNRVKLSASNLFRALGKRRYDLIVSNPPYVTSAAMRRLPREYGHEPALALAGGASGLDAVSTILREARGHLNPGGLLVVEVGGGRQRVERAFPRLPFYWPDTAGGETVFLLEREQLKRGDLQTQRTRRTQMDADKKAGKR